MSNNRITRLTHRLFVCALATLLSCSLAHAATITVTSTADSGAGSLRQAIADAAANDTIAFSGNGTITLASELAVNKNLSFVGNGVGNTIIDGNNSVRLFSVDRNITVSWADMTLTRGRANDGGCIYALNPSVVTLTRVTANACAAILNLGGAIHGYSVNLTDSTISGNSATSWGGGIFAFGDLMVSNSTITANSVGARGGGIYFQPSSGNALTILHSTISGNTASEGGGIYVFLAPPISIGHTVLAGNNASISSPDAYGPFASTGYNVIGNTTGMTITGTTTGNIINGAASPLSLGPLADNGGPTKTMAIGVDSVAYNAGDPSFSGSPSTDQRGTARVKMGRIDIGAYESSDPVVAITPSTLNIAEGSSANVTLTRTGSTASALTVNLSITQGTGITGADYTLSGASISGQSGSVTATIPAGNSSVNIAVAAQNDVIQESSEVLTLTLVDALSYDLGATTSSAATLLDNDFVLTVTTAGTGSGTVGGSAAGTYNAGSALTLTATPDTGSTFSGWSTGCSASFNMPSSDLTCTATFVPATTSRSSISTISSGVTATLSAAGCSAVDSATFIAPPAGAPSNTSFPYGLLDFTLSGCAGSATVTVTYSQNLPSGATFYKIRTGTYQTYTASVGFNSVTFTLTDNDSWDGDGGAGVIKDPGGLGFGSTTSIPTLSEWGMIILSALLALGSFGVMRRRQV
jgi:hypothetical protein